MIYFDNAATTGHKPQSVVKAMNYALTNLSANPGRSGHDISQSAAAAMYNTRSAISDFFGGSGAENVIFTANCTQSINMVLKGVLDYGDNVVISDMEHNAVIRPINVMNISYSIANVSLDNDSETVNNFKKAIHSKTKMIFCTAASNVLGKKLPLKKIGDLCREYGLLFGVDAAQAAGVIPINMQEMNIDFLCIAPHKGLYAPMGLGILIAQKPIKKTIIEGGTGTDSLNAFQPSMMPERFESGTVNLPAITATKAGLDFISGKVDCIYRREMKLVSRLYDNLLRNKKIIFYTEPEYNGFVPVLPFNVNGKTSDEVAEYLNKNGVALRAGLHCAPTAHKKIGTAKIGAVRFSPSVFNTVQEVDRLIYLLNNI